MEKELDYISANIIKISTHNTIANARQHDS